MSLTVRLLATSLIALLASACTVAGGPASEPPGSPAPSGPAVPSASPSVAGIVYPTGSSDLVLRLRNVGGFVAPVAHFLETPVISVYGDGTVIVPGPQIAIYPGPALPNLQRATISPAGMQILLAAARDAGLLGPDAHYDLVGIADAGTAEFTLNAEGRIHKISAYALMEGGNGPLGSGADPAVTAARAKLATFQGQLGNFQALLGSELGSWSQYQADAVQLIVSRGAPDDGQGLVQQPLAWPLTTHLGGFGATLPELMEGQRCGVVSGADLDLLMPLLQKANSLTPWLDANLFGVAVRPLLPDETGCAG
jgi:hypothetical protein